MVRLSPLPVGKHCFLNCARRKNACRKAGVSIACRQTLLPKHGSWYWREEHLSGVSIACRQTLLPKLGVSYESLLREDLSPLPVGKHCFLYSENLQGPRCEGGVSIACRQTLLPKQI